MTIAGYPNYEKYRTVEISWCPAIPHHWHTLPVRTLFTESRRKNSDGKITDYLSLMANRGIIPYAEKGDVGNKMPADLTGCKVVEVDDFVINSMNFGIGSFGLSKLRGICSSVYVILKAENSATIRFYERIFQHPQFQKFSQSLGNGILAHRCAIGWDELKNAHFPVPPDDELQAIADFLDDKTRKIDAAIAHEERQIALLKERKQIVIRNAVTKGLNPNAPMKDSGVDWIGEIPAHWAQLAQKHIFRLKKSTVGKRSSEYDLLSLTLRGIIKRDMENPEGKFPAEFDTYQEVMPGDFVFCHFDVEETPRTVGLSEHSGMITGAYTVYTPSAKHDPRYLLHFHIFADTDKKLRSLYKGLRNTISKDVFGAFKMPIPPKDEQRSIVEYINRESRKIDDAIEIKKSQISALAEYKATLINSAVTGKIKVA